MTNKLKTIFAGLVTLAFLTAYAVPATAQIKPPPVKKSAVSNYGGNKFKVTGESVMQMQGVSIGCAAFVEIADSIAKANGPDPRELTPVGAVDNAAACGLAPAIIIKVFNWIADVKDNDCSLNVARRALKENNTPRARQELLWRDGSWELRQAKFLVQYAACYRLH